MCLSIIYCIFAPSKVKGADYISCRRKSKRNITQLHKFSETKYCISKR